MRSLIAELMGVPGEGVEILFPFSHKLPMQLFFVAL
jgi:hypothetical protein